LQKYPSLKAGIQVFVKANLYIGEALYMPWERDNWEGSFFPLIRKPHKGKNQKAKLATFRLKVW